MGKGAPSTTTQTTKVELPKWVNEASQSNYQMAQEIAAKPFEQYQGNTVAGPGALTLDAYKLLGDNAGKSLGLYDEAAGLASSAGKGILGMDRAAYTSPYTNDVVNAAMSDLDDQRIKALMGNSDAAIAAGAFGGSRHGVVEAVTNSESAKAAGTLSANLRDQAFNTATGLMQGDVASKLAASGALGATAQGRDQSVLSNFGGLMTAGANQQGQEQKVIDANVGKFNEARGADTEKLNLLLSSLGMSPYGKSETAKSTTPNAGTDWATTGLGALTALGSFFSDENAKTDIKKLGKDPVSGIDLYAYRYKGDPKSYPKVVGPMAQDIEKLDPSAVRRINGHLTVNLA